MGSQPLSHARICLCEGEQGEGKSVTAVARVIGASIRSIVAIRNGENGKEYKAVALSKDDKEWLRAKDIPYFFDTVKMQLEDDWHIGRIPDNYIIVPSIGIFCNFHLYGVEYTYATMAQIIEWLDKGLIRDGYLVLDENYITGNARESHAAFSRALTKYSNTFRKRHLNVIMMYPHERMADWIYRWAVREWILCSYDEKTYIVTLTIKKRREREKVVSFYAPQYWKYYDTDELPRLPASQVDKAKEAVMSDFERQIIREEKARQLAEKKRLAKVDSGSKVGDG